MKSKLRAIFFMAMIFAVQTTACAGTVAPTEEEAKAAYERHVQAVQETTQSFMPGRILPLARVANFNKVNGQSGEGYYKFFYEATWEWENGKRRQKSGYLLFEETEKGWKLSSVTGSL